MDFKWIPLVFLMDLSWITSPKDSQGISDGFHLIWISCGCRMDSKSLAIHWQVHSQSIGNQFEMHWTPTRKSHRKSIGINTKSMGNTHKMNVKSFGNTWEINLKSIGSPLQSHSKYLGNAFEIYETSLDPLETLEID